MQPQLGIENDRPAGKATAQKKPPLLFYEGRDLHQVVTLKAFIKEYGTLYAKLYGKYLTLPKS
jgi:hypothetical protein